MRCTLFALSLLLATGMVPVQAVAAPGSAQAIEEVFTIEFYDGIVVTSMKMANGDFLAVLSTGGEGSPGAIGGRVAARYQLHTQARIGLWQVPGEGVDRTFDYRGFQPPGGLALDDFLARHSVRSVALSALMLWEEEAGSSELSLVQMTPSASEPLLQQRGLVPVCDECSADVNGCSPGWVIPDSCAGSSIRTPCDQHDACYQCGAICSGTSRSECDSRFRQAVYQATGNWWCASIYYWGVRGLGWIFYQDPNQRADLGPDVYYIGIELSACEGEYSHLCTHYVM